MAEDHLPRYCAARLGSARWRAPGPAMCVRFTPDGKAIAVVVDVPSGRTEYGVLLYDRVSGDRTEVIKGHGRPLTHIEYSPRGTQLVSCGYDGSILMHDLAARTCKRLFLAADRAVDSVRFSRDGALLASAHHSPYVVRIWDWNARREIARTAPAEFWADALAFSPDGSLLATASEATVWDARTGTRIREWSRDILHTPFDRSKTVVSVGFNELGDQLAVVTDQSVSHYDIRSGERRRCVRLTPERYARVFAATADGSLWAIGTFGNFINSIEIWDAKSGQRLRELTGHIDLIQSLAFSDDGTTLVSGSDDHTIRVWDVATGACSFTDVGHQHSVRDLAFADGATLVSIGHDGCRIWDLPSAAEVRSTGRPGQLDSLVVNRSRRVAFIGEEIGLAKPAVVNVVDIASGDEVGRITRKKGSSRVIALAPTSERLFTTSYKGAVHSWDARTGDRLARFGRFKREYNGIVCLAVSPDEKIIAIGCGYGVVEVWDLEKSEPLHEPLEHGDEFDGAPSCVAFSRDGSALAAAGEDGTIRVWRTSDYALMGELRANEELINRIAFSPDGLLLGSAGSDGVVRLWDVKTSRHLCELTGHAGVVTSVAFSPNGKLLASGSYDTTILIWDIQAARRGAR